MTTSHRAWQRKDTGTFVPSPVEHAGKVYLVRDRGEVERIEPATGKTLWSGLLPKSGSSYYSSPSFADGKLYAAREDGVVFVARADGKFEVLAENNMGSASSPRPCPWQTASCCAANNISSASRRSSASCRWLAERCGRRLQIAGTFAVSASLEAKQLHRISAEHLGARFR